MNEAQARYTNSEVDILKALNRKFWMDTETRRLNECGWGDFYGISYSTPYDLDKLAKAGLLQVRPSPHWENWNEYRLTGNGRDFVDALPEEQLCKRVPAASAWATGRGE